MNDQEKEFLSNLFHVAVAAADPLKCLKGHLPPRPKGRTVVIGAGKGVAQLASAFESLWDGPLTGLVVTRYGYSTDCKCIRVLEASHPVPDSAGLAASTELFELVKNLDSDDLVVALICGGGSALLPAPPDGFTLEDERLLNESLLKSGAPISAMNGIRKHFSKIKGGRLAQAASPARVVSLIVSDVPGDDPAQVASGPTVPDSITANDALGFVSSYNINLPDRIMEHLKAENPAAPSPNSPEFERNEVSIVASSSLSLEAAASTARKEGFCAEILTDSLEGESKEAAKVLAAIAREIRLRDRPFRKPVVILSGGETTVTLSGNGKGGRNTEFLLSFAIGIDGLEGISCLAADTDGIDGSEDNAGAFVSSDSVQRLRKSGIDPAQLLSDNDAWTAFHNLGDLFVTGPTGTNVNDFRVILIR